MVISYLFCLLTFNELQGILHFCFLRLKQVKNLIVVTTNKLENPDLKIFRNVKWMHLYFVVVVIKRFNKIAKQMFRKVVLNMFSFFSKEG